MLNAIPFPFEPDRIRSIRPALARATGLVAAELVSAELPARLGLGAAPAQHGALSDARAIRSALEELRRSRAPLTPPPQGTCPRLAPRVRRGIPRRSTGFPAGPLARTILAMSEIRPGLADE